MGAKRYRLMLADSRRSAFGEKHKKAAAGPADLVGALMRRDIAVGRAVMNPRMLPCRCLGGKAFGLAL